MDQVVAFGDNYNDIDLLQQVGIGVAVGNARPEVKAVANFITLHHKEDGVADFLEKNFPL
jgi:hydroxymethylpyrimidine pyrophosphatase-like HAD family hydrolase